MYSVEYRLDGQEKEFFTKQGQEIFLFFIGSWLPLGPIISPLPVTKSQIKKNKALHNRCFPLS
jgi:hypothetical protein